MGPTQFRTHCVLFWELKVKKQSFTTSSTPSLGGGGENKTVGLPLSSEGNGGVTDNTPGEGGSPINKLLIEILKFR